ncbi:MAG TPA: VOC family protein [Candidatus Nanopelagicales bacterium]|nr:VOC family protein [Candidatus Nanopelagicales bacterium]
MTEPLTFQVVVDCRQPHVLADWWAETLGWVVEPQDEAFIRSMVDQGYADESETMRHKGSLVWATGAAINAPEGMTAPRLLFQTAPEGKTVKNRLHLDLRGSSDVEALRASLEARGATRLWEASQGPHSWVTYADPEGNEFCA